MSERVVDSPANHGWVDAGGGKWAWAGSGGSGGGAGAGMVISETEPADKVEGMQWLNPTNGLLLFWDDEKWLQMPTTGAAGKDGADGVDGLWTDDGDGHASYSGGKFSQLRITRSGASSDNQVSGVVFNNDATTNGVGITGGYDQGFKFYATTDSKSGQPLDNSVRTELMSVDSSGRLNLQGGDFYLGNGDGIGVRIFSSDALVPRLGYASSDGEMDIGDSAYRFKNGYFSGSVTSTRMIADGHLVMSTRDLIETLSTLRNATKDESTLEGLRDAIGNAVGGLIEKFEAMQAEANDE